MKKLFISLLGMLWATCNFAQVKGRVLEIGPRQDTSAVPGVIVLWNNTAVNSSTDENGRFTIPVMDSISELHIRAIGYDSQVITVKDTSKFITVILKNGIEKKQVKEV